MTAIKQSKLFFAFALVAVFCFLKPHFAYATSANDQPDGSQSVSSTLSSRLQLDYPSWVAGTSSAVTVYYKAPNCTDTLNVTLNIYYYGGSVFYVNNLNYYNLPCNSTDYQELILNYPAVYIPNAHIRVQIDLTKTIDVLGTYSPADPSFGEDVTGYLSGFYPKIYYNGANDYAISFNSGFTDNMTTPDFSVWQVQLTFPDGLYNPGWEVEYKQASSTYWQYFDKEFLNGYGSGNFNNVVSNFRKKTPLPPGNYVALAVLFSNSEPLATSGNLNFTVTNENAITTPGTSPVPTTSIYTLLASSTPESTLYNDSGCVDTSFSVLGADFGKGICQVFAFLFVPGQAALNQYADTQTLLENKAPFSYLYEIGTDLTNLNPTTSTMTPLTLMVGSTSTPIHLSFDIFSANTIDKYTDPTSRGIVRTLIQWTLYLAFLTMVIWEVRNIFKPKGPIK